MRDSSEREDETKIWAVGVGVGAITISGWREWKPSRSDRQR